MKKEIALKPPCREYDVQGMESWLQYQSLSGNRLFETAGRTFYFQEAEPKKLVFRLEPHGKKQISEEQKEDWKKRGWSYAASYRRLYDIFFSETEERDEAEALASSQSVGLQFLDQRFGSWRLLGIFFIALAAVLCWLSWKNGDTILQFLYGNGPFAVLLLAAFTMFWLSAWIMGAWIRGQTEKGRKIFKGSADILDWNRPAGACDESLRILRQSGGDGWPQRFSKPCQNGRRVLYSGFRTGGTDRTELQDRKKSPGEEKPLCRTVRL